MTDPQLIADLKRDEGVRRFAYPDSLGFLTIGVGRLIDSRRGGGLSNDEIDYLLGNDVKRVGALLDGGLPWWRSLDPVRQRVIQNMCFNMGWGDPKTPAHEGLSGFTNTLEAVRTHDWDRAAVGMLTSKWATQVGDRAKRLAQQMRTGQP